MMEQSLILNDAELEVTVEYTAQRDSDLSTGASWVDVDVIKVLWRGLDIMSALTYEELGQIGDRILEYGETNKGEIE